MRAKLDSAQGKADYAQRSRTIEPVFGQVKTVQGGRRFMRRGLRACAAEWKLLCGTHNLQALAHDHSHQPLTGTNHQAPPPQDRTDYPHRRHEQFSGHARGNRRRHCATGSLEPVSDLRPILVARASDGHDRRP
jgi:hypothetical protein